MRKSEIQKQRLRQDFFRPGVCRPLLTGQRASAANVFSQNLLWMFMVAVFLLGCLPATALAAPPTYRIGVLQVGDNRREPMAGLQDGLAEHRRESGCRHLLEVRNAQGKRELLPQLAAELVALRPQVLIAAGGVEADALRLATLENQIPVVFLAVSSAVKRGLAKSMKSSENNLTGIDTNDTQLTEKRLWFLRKVLPSCRRVAILNDPTIPPSANSTQVARQAASQLGLDLRVFDVGDRASIMQAISALDKTKIDAVMMVPIPWKGDLCQEVFQAVAAKGIPAMGAELVQIDFGAALAYAPSRYACGRQATSMVHKILHGTAPRDIPLEVPEKIDFVISRPVVKKLGLKIPRSVFRLADRIAD